MTDKKTIHTAILDVMKQVGYVKKEGKVEFGRVNYSYAGEAHLIKAIRPHLLEADVYCYPLDIKPIRSQDSVRTDKEGKPIIDHRAMMKYIFRFVHAPSETFIDVPAMGDCVDTTDKAVYKAATGAYKYALRQALMIETGDDPDKPMPFKTKREANEFYTDLMKEIDEGISTCKQIQDLYDIFHEYKIDLARIEAHNEDLYKDFVLTKFENAKKKLGQGAF